LSISDDAIDKLQPMEFKPHTIDLPVPKSAYEEFELKDSAVINKGQNFLVYEFHNRRRKC